MRPDQITRQTELFGLLGDALEKSSDADMINRFFDGNGVDAFCSIFNIREEDMPFFLTQIKTKPIRALFVRSSHMAWCLEYLDRKDAVTEATGYLDAVIITDGALQGIAAAPSALCAKLGVKARCVAVLGNSPRAKAYALAAARSGARSLILADEHLEWLAETAQMLKRHAFEGEIRLERCAPGATTDLSGAEVVINTLQPGETMQPEYPKGCDVINLTGGVPSGHAGVYYDGKLVLLEGVSETVNRVLGAQTCAESRYRDEAEVTEIF